MRTHLGEVTNCPNVPKMWELALPCSKLGEEMGKNMLRKMLNSHDFFQQNLLSHVCTTKILSPPLMLWHRSQKDLICQQGWVLRNYNKAIRAPYVAVAVTRSELSTDPREMFEFSGPPAVKTQGPSTCTVR